MEQAVISGFSDEICKNFDEQLKAVKEFSLTHIELRSADGVNVSNFTEEKCREVREKLLANGISVSSVGSPIGKIGILDDFEPHLEKFRHTLHIAKMLDAPYIRMFSFYYPKEEGAQQHRDEVFRRLERLIALAKEQGAVLLHENEKGIYGDTAARCRELMERFYGPHFKAVFDFANFVECGVDTLEAYAMMKPYIEYVHIKDARASDRKVVPPGMGDGKLKEILGDLLENGYRGFLSVEPHLTDFAGLKALEENAETRDSKMDGKSAWKLALDSLKGVLAACRG